MLLGGLKESQQNVINMRDIQYSSFMVILEYLYTQKAYLPDQVNLLEVLSLANLYILEDLKSQIIKEVKKILSAENVEGVKSIAHSLNMPDLMAICTEFSNKSI